MADQYADQVNRYRDIAEALHPALADDPFYRTMEDSVEDTARSKEAMLNYYGYSIYESARFGKIVEPDEGRYGVSVWSVPLSASAAKEKSRQKRQFIQQEMGGGCLVAYESINEFMAHSARSVTTDQDWYLSILGILPEHQGKGLGVDLIRPVLQMADAAGVATFLETFTPRNMSFYERLGYATAGSFSEPVTASRYWLMRREPTRA